MSTPFAAGELMMIGFDGPKVTPALEEWIVKRKAGGVILFSRNMQSMAQTAQLIADMQQLRKKVSAEPLFVGVDQEGGAVMRFLRGMTVLPGNMAIGSIQSEDCAYAAGRIIATEMSLLGFNMNFGPVLDLSCHADNAIVGVRSFGENPALAGRLGVAMLQGLQENGMLAVGKHFPGLGRCHADPHEDLPMVAANAEDMEKNDVMPFVRAIHAGIKGLMPAHAVFRAWEEKGLVPATFSRRILHNLLRSKLGFRGLVISDDLEMGALRKYFDLRETARRGLDAGLDIFMVCHDPAKQLEIFHTLQEAAKQGGPRLEAMQAGAGRIHEAKKSLARPQSARDVTMHTLGVHKQVAERMGRDSITLVKNEKAAIPLELDRKQKILLLAPVLEGQTQVEDSARDEDAEPHLLRLFREEHANTKLLTFELSPSETDFQNLKDCGSYDVILLMTYNAHLHVRQIEYAKAVLRRKPDAVVVALRNPYDLAALPQAATALATYGFRECSLKGLVQALFGEIIPKGIMPVRLETNA